MAELIDEDEVNPVKQRLSLKIVAGTTSFDPDLHVPVTNFQIGLFLGGRPLFCDAYYPASERTDAGTVLGCLWTDEEEFRLLSTLSALLDRPERLDYESDGSPAFRLLIEPNSFKGRSGQIGTVFGLVVILTMTASRGSTGGSGPAAALRVSREGLARFVDDLREEYLAHRLHQPL